VSLLLIDEDGTVLRREDERFVVSRKAVDLLEVRSSELSEIVLIGRIEVTRAAINLALSRNIPIYFEGSYGKLYGSLQPPMPSGANLREQQYRVLEDKGSQLKLSQYLLDAQIRNQRGLLRRLTLNREHTDALDKPRAEMKTLLESIPQRDSCEELRGVEGYSTRLFLSGLKSILDPSLGFSTRSVRSDKDPFNTVLDICGGLLASTCRSALEVARLDPYKGALHGTSRNGPALALDLEDVYRPLLVAATAVSLFTKKTLADEDFVRSNGKCRIAPQGLTKTCKLFGSNLRREVTREDSREAKSYLQHIHDDARMIARWVDEPDTQLDFLTVK
jgi:CRISPR-associated endonuclease Cas1